MGCEEAGTGCKDADIGCEIGTACKEADIGYYSNSEYCKGYAFEVLVWPNAPHLLHLDTALGAAALSTASKPLGSY